jgi:hypothetical protein
MGKLLFNNETDSTYIKAKILNYEKLIISLAIVSGSPVGMGAIFHHSRRMPAKCP